MGSCGIEKIYIWSVFIFSQLFIKKKTTNIIKKEIKGFPQKCCRISVLPLHTSSVKPGRSLMKEADSFEKGTGAAVNNRSFFFLDMFSS